MGEVAITVAKWAMKLAFWMACVLSLLVVIGIAGQYIIMGMNMSVIGDVFAVIQIWCPFNISLLIVWMVALSTAYIGYRLALMAYNLINAYIGK